LGKARACARHFDKYRAKGATASEGLRNQVLHDFFFAIGAVPLYARWQEAEIPIPPDIRKLVSSLSEFGHYVKQRHNPNVISMVDRIEAAFGDTVDNYFEDSRMVFNQVGGVPLHHEATHDQAHMVAMIPPREPEAARPQLHDHHTVTDIPRETVRPIHSSYDTYVAPEREAVRPQLRRTVTDIAPETEWPMPYDTYAAPPDRAANPTRDVTYEYPPYHPSRSVTRTSRDPDY
jgi:hypothetical protein